MSIFEVALRMQANELLKAFQESETPPEKCAVLIGIMVGTGESAHCEVVLEYQDKDHDFARDSLLEWAKKLIEQPADAQLAAFDVERVVE